MSATLFLQEPLLDGSQEFECDEVRLLGSVIWAKPAGSARQYVVPLENVLGIEGDEVEQRVEELPSRGGQFTELITEVS